jgi:hypothetical protein
MVFGVEDGSAEEEQGKRKHGERSHRAFLNLARALLVLALVGSGWFVYRRLPPEAAKTSFESHNISKTNLRIILQTRSAQALAGAAVELYSIDTVAAEREYLSERRAGVRFEQFLREMTKARPTVSGRFNERGEAILTAAPGRWWIHARSATDDAEWTWRLPVNIAGREQRIELTPENAYTRTQSY